ncbi:hypothetical protein IFR05_006745 [Cadophora sp. M221]|nr:hypothetical protein IFR05_006745 [Cadophora sp. M221]
MQFFAVVSIMFLAFSCPTVLADDASATESTPSKFKDFPTTPMTFNGTIGGIPIVHEGTIQEIVAHMTHKYPGFALDISADIADTADTSNTADMDAAKIIPRYDGNWGDGKIATFTGEINRDYLLSDELEMATP